MELLLIGGNLGFALAPLGSLGSCSDSVKSFAHRQKAHRTERNSVSTSIGDFGAVQKYNLS